MTQYILLSHERSGSHFVGEFISGLRNFHVYDEVCNPHAVPARERPESFYGFRYNYLQKHPELLLDVTYDGHYEWMRAYFQSLADASPVEHSVIDIKYGHVHKFELHWWQALARPMLISFCEYEGIGIIHLYRENVVEAVASYMIAEQRQVWHTWQEGAEKARKKKVTIDAGKLVADALLLLQQISLTQRWLGNARHLTMTYEGATKGLARGGLLGEELCRFLGSERDLPFEPSHRKVTQKLASAIANFDEVHAACELAGLGRHL